MRVVWIQPQIATVFEPKSNIRTGAVHLDRFHGGGRCGRHNDRPRTADIDRWPRGRTRRRG